MTNISADEYRLTHFHCRSLDHSFSTASESSSINWKQFRPSLMLNKLNYLLPFETIFNFQSTTPCDDIFISHIHHVTTYGAALHLQYGAPSIIYVLDAS